jgi:hypothetical protein
MDRETNGIGAGREPGRGDPPGAGLEGSCDHWRSWCWKTTIVNSILRILSTKGVNLLLCATTGRAAKRMKEAIGFEAKTIDGCVIAPVAGPRSARCALRYSVVDELTVLAGQLKTDEAMLCGRSDWAKEHNGRRRLATSTRS